MLYSALLKVIHLVIGFATFVNNIINSVWILLFFEWRRPVTVRTLMDLPHKVEKIPKHLSMAILDEPSRATSVVSLDSIARLVAWTIVTGIPEASLWDPSGYLKTRAKILEQRISEELESIENKSGGTGGVETPPAVNIIMREQQSSAIDGFQLPGTTQQRSFQLHLWSQDDGRQAILKGCKSYSQARSRAKEKTESGNPLSPDEFQQYLGYAGEPDLVILFGTTDTVGGYMPWQLRVAEMLRIPSHRNVSLGVFVDCLEKFGHINRRYGK